MRFYRHSLLGLFLAALTLGLLTLAFAQIADALGKRSASGPVGPSSLETIANVPVMTIYPGVVTPLINAFGEVRARHSLELRAPAAGRIVWAAPGLATGATVSAGMLLVRLDQAEAIAARDLAKADLDSRMADRTQAKGRLALARDELAAAETQLALRVAATARQRDLLARGAGSAAAVEDAELAQASATQANLGARQSVLTATATLAEAEAAIARQEITLAEAARRLSDTEIRAGFTGVLDAVTVVEGGLVGANERLATLIDPTALDLWIRLSTDQFGRLLDDQGQLRAAPVTAILPSGQAPLQADGRLDRAGASLAEGESGRLVIARLDLAPGLRPGDFLSASIAEPDLQNAVLLPGTALGADGTVLALGADDRLEPLAVTVLRQQGETVIVSTAGLAGRDIVTTRTAQTGAGIKIRPVHAPGGTGGRIALDAASRARLVALVQADTSLAETDRQAIITALKSTDVAADLVARINARAGG